MNIDITQIYKDYRDMIVGHVVKNSGSEEDGEDIMHESIITFIKNLDKKDFQLTSTPENFLFGIARNLWLKVLAHKRRHIMYGDNISSIDVPVDPNYDMEETRELVQKCLNQLNDKERQLLDCVYFQGLTMKEVAKVVGYTTDDSAKMSKYRAKKNFDAIVAKAYSREDLVC